MMIDSLLGSVNNTSFFFTYLKAFITIIEIIIIYNNRTTLVSQISLVFHKLLLFKI